MLVQHGGHRGDVHLSVVGCQDDTEEAGQKMVERTGVTYRNARDPRSEIASVYGLVGLPRTVLIGGDGTVLAVHNGEMDAAAVTAMLNQHGITAT